MQKFWILLFLLLLSGYKTFTNGFELVSIESKSFIQNIEQKTEHNSFENKLKKSGIDNSKFLLYKEMNDNEQNYIEFKDNDEMFLAKLVMLEYINKSRAKYGVKKLELDILACRVANKMCLEAAENDFKGHWNLRGEKPYHRYALAGGVDHVTENAASWWLPSNYINNYKTAVKYMKGSHDNFIAETNEGHKKNVIAKDHNYVGLGYAHIGNQFRYYEEYIDRYIDVLVEDIYFKKNERTLISFKPLTSKLYPYAIIVYYEPPLMPMSRDEINRKQSYPDFSNNIIKQIWYWELPERDANGYITIKIFFRKKGTYYLNIYLTNRFYDERYATVAGKISASGIVFFVE